VTDDDRSTPGAHARIYHTGPTWDGHPAAAIGKIRFETAGAGAALLQDITAELHAEGVSRLLGPMDGDTWHSYRLVSESDGSPPFLMEPVSAPHDLHAFQQAGFDPVGHYFSARARLEQTIGTAPAPNPDIVIRPWDGADPEAHFTAIHELSMTAFRDNAFYTPIDRETFLAMYMPFVPMLRKELVFMARARADDRLLGFLFGIPDYAQGPQTQTVILKTYASLHPGVGRLLAHAFHGAARDLGFTWVIHALIHDANRSAARSRMHGATVFRRYVLMGRRLAD